MEKQSACVQEFEKGLNIITSADNHVGKSSLLKSLYYTLGSEVHYDSAWNKNTKIYIVTIDVDEDEFRFVRFMKSFVVFHNGKLIKMTNSVMHELSPLLEEIFGFAVYLPNKQTQKVELAPPTFLYMPYYIVQDEGWSGIFYLQLQNKGLLCYSNLLKT